MITTEVLIDIETYPEIPDGMLDILRAGIKAPGNIKDPEKIKAALAKKEAALVEKAALSPLTAKIVIVAAGWRPIGHNGEFTDKIFHTKSVQEAEMLADLDELLHDLRVMKLITYNGARFDLPFLAARAMKHGMTLDFKWPVGRYHPLHIDMFDVLGEGSLEKWNILLGGAPKEVGGETIADLIDAGKWDVAIRHCRQDIQMLGRIYDRYTAVTYPKGR